MPELRDLRALPDRRNVGFDVERDAFFETRLAPKGIDGWRK